MAEPNNVTQAIANSDVAQESSPAEGSGTRLKRKRKIVAVGDLHGDYGRLTRIMDEQGLIIEGTWAWDPYAGNVDLVLIGDYVDWRGEPLEGDPSRWKEGPKKTLHLIYYLFHKLRELREIYGPTEGFDSYIYPILGNHDQMMLDATMVFTFMDFNQVNQVINFRQNYAPLKKFLNDIHLDYDQIDKVMKFLNWYYQGGDATIEGFGGIEVWKEEMDGQLGDFLRNNLLLGCKVNNRMFSHSLPDRREFWKPIGELLKLPEKERLRAREAFIWGRRIWGIDAYTNMKTPQPDMHEVDEMLDWMEVKGAVVGHTPMLRRDPAIAYDGKIVNIDLHGVPGSGAYIEEYYAEVPPGVNFEISEDTPSETVVTDEDETPVSVLSKRLEEILELAETEDEEPTTESAVTRPSAVELAMGIMARAQKAMMSMIAKEEESTLNVVDEEPESDPVEPPKAESEPPSEMAQDEPESETVQEEEEPPQDQFKEMNEVEGEILKTAETEHQISNEIMEDKEESEKAEKSL